MCYTNCPNCGAPLRNGKCEYCETEVYSNELRSILMANEDRSKEIVLEKPKEVVNENMKVYLTYKDGKFSYISDGVVNTW